MIRREMIVVGMQFNQEGYTPANGTMEVIDRATNARFELPLIKGIQLGDIVEIHITKKEK